MEAAPVPFPTRFVLAFALFFRVLFDALFAGRVKSLTEGESHSLPSPETRDAAKPAPTKDEDAPARRREGALALLSLLQREGRLVDFLQQDIAAFPDAEIGAAARVVHDGCRKSLRAHFDVSRVRTEAEGSAVTVPAGFDAAAVKLTGDVRGAAPYHGTLRHSGWRVDGVRLPERVDGHDAAVVFPAEVEL